MGKMMTYRHSAAVTFYAAVHRQFSADVPGIIAEVRIGFLCSVPETVHAFFEPWIHEWRLQGHTVFPAAGPDPDGHAFSVHCEVITGLGQRPSLGSLRGPSAIKRWVAENDLDLVITNTATASFLARARPLDVPVFYFCHGLHWGTERTGSGVVYERLERWALPNTRGAIVSNTADRDWFRNQAPELPLLYLPSGVGLDLEKFPATPPPPAGSELRIAWMGAMTSRKRPEDAIAVQDALASMAVRSHLFMAGHGPMQKRVEELARGRSDISLVGRVDSRSFLTDSHVLLHTSAWEGLSRSVLEANAIGRPSIGYDVKGVRDAPGAMTIGKPGDVRELAELVNQWWSGNIPQPEIDRDQLDWRMSFNMVTNFIERHSGKEIVRASP
jgi:glycosyltransferase involved in cell wall biosynthesis